MTSTLARQAAQISNMNPELVLAAGDWHGNPSWGRQVIQAASRILPRDRTRIIIQLGDFGIWPGVAGGDYLKLLSAELEKRDIRLWFIDGNHECFPLLENLRAGRPGIVPVDDDGRIYHLPRGFRWTWHGRNWMALGGAHSIDRAVRTEGLTWWPQETITDEQEALASSRPCDVLLSHDCPSGVRHEFSFRPAAWAQEDVDASDEHRQRLQRVVDKTQPSHIAHGHLHRVYWRTCDFGYGPVQVTGLDMDGTRFNCALLDTKLMSWSPL